MANSARFAIAGLYLVMLSTAVEAEMPTSEAASSTTEPRTAFVGRSASRRLRQAAAAARRAKARHTDDTSSAEIVDYIDRTLGLTAAARPARMPGRAVATTTKPVALATEATVATAVKPSSSEYAFVPARVTSPIATGALSPPQPLTPETRAIGDVPDALIIAAERSQARLDLVKLEFASRTTNETKLSGQQVFEFRKDWHVLERARDALSGAEAASAGAAGFEANAYINEATRTIVVAIAGSQDLRRDSLTADLWKALIKAEAPQQFYLAKTYVRSIIQRYQMQGYSTECIGHSLGGGACAYAASELGIRALVLNPISAGRLAPAARFLVTNYIVNGDIANLFYGASDNEFPGGAQVMTDSRDVVRQMVLDQYGPMAGPVLVVRASRGGVHSYLPDHALDFIAAQAEADRPR